MLLVLIGLYYWTAVSRVLLLWAAFILTRPLGATVGDFLDKPIAKGGLEVSRPLASALLLGVIVLLVLVIPQKAGSHPTNGEPPLTITARRGTPLHRHPTLRP